MPSFRVFSYSQILFCFSINLITFNNEMILKRVYPQASRYWSSYGTLMVDDKANYQVVIEAMYIGKPEDDSADFNNFEDWFKEVYPDKLVMNTENTHDTFLDKLLSQVGVNVQPRIWWLINQFGGGVQG